MQDLRLPLADGQPIQFLTTRDTGDPDALYVLRHSSAHLLAEAVRRLYPGVKVAIGPPIENGFYYDFEFPEPITEADLAKIEDEVKREIEEGREWSREEIPRDEAKARFAAEGEPYKVELVDTAEGDISLYTQGDFTDLCRGPHLQNAKPIKAFKLTGLAGAYWRGDEHNKQLTRIYGTAFYSQADLDAYLERLEEARKRDHRRLGVQLDLFHLSEISPGSPFWHPKGMVIWNELEDLRRREDASRGYVEVQDAAHLRQGALGDVGPLGEVPRAHVPDPGGRAHLRAQADELPGAHGRSSRTSCGATASCRSASPRRRPLHRNERAGTLHGLTRVRHVTQDDAHIFCTREQIEDEIFGCLDYAKFIYDLLRARVELRALDPAGEQARHRRGVGLHRRRARALRSTGAGSSTRSTRATARSTGRRSTCTCTTRSAAPGRWGPSSSTARCRSGSTAATSAPTTPSTSRT